ncbi:MAG: ribonuclease HII [Deltaproteobacteria bacterium]|nr:ribonuclease HII [Deltaproteobacteria bacterium]
MRFFESQAHNLGYRTIAGIDEAGRGPLAGPVVAAAVILPDDYGNVDIRDSKALTARKRELLYRLIMTEARSVGIGIVESVVIDRINILQAALKAMKRAVNGLKEAPDYLLIDGRDTIDLEIPQRAVIRGDQQSISIAAASIVAKVCRDHLMERYHLQYSQYNFARNKGYPTKEHREAIHRHGFCKIHRRSFLCKID